MFEVVDLQMLHAKLVLESDSLLNLFTCSQPEAESSLVLCYLRLYLVEDCGEGRQGEELVLKPAISWFGDWIEG